MTTIGKSDGGKSKSMSSQSTDHKTISTKRSSAFMKISRRIRPTVNASDVRTITVQGEPKIALEAAAQQSR